MSSSPRVAPPAGAQDGDDVVAGAREAVQRAGAVAGVRLDEVHSLDGLRQAAAIWQQVWSRDAAPPVSVELLRALAHAGNYVGGAYEGSRMVGALLGFYGGGAGVDHVHSHMLGVERPLRSRGVGFALKQHQRLWTLERGIDRITWTYDPLVRTNGFFNVAKLGAVGVDYLVAFYGEMADAINAGDRTDRVLIEWDLAGSRATAASAGVVQVADRDTELEAGAEIALTLDGSGGPALGPGRGDHLLVRVPDDVVALRRSHPAQAPAWREALRSVLVDAVGRGLRIHSMTRDGWYVVRRPGEDRP